MHLSTPEPDFAAYTFGDATIKHHFCPNCGCAPFGLGINETGEMMVAVNVRCLDDVDIASLKVNHVDGRSV